MAVTGAILSVFIVFHLLGNLLIFGGRDAINAYANMLKSIPEVLWVVRVVLIVALILHVYYSVVLAIRNWTARPVGYSFREDVETSYAARTMIISGPLILLYAIYHLMMFTFLTTGPGYSRTDVYANLVAAFSVPMISVVYMLAMVVLGFHLYHGLWSMFHSVGISGRRYRRWRWFVAPGVAILISAGYISIPLAVLTHLVK